MPDARETRRLLFLNVLREVVRPFGGLIPLIYIHPLFFQLCLVGMKVALLGFRDVGHQCLQNKRMIKVISPVKADMQDATVLINSFILS